MCNNTSDQYLPTHQILSMTFCAINTRINASEINSSKCTFFNYFNRCLTFTKTHIHIVPLSSNLELLSILIASFLVTSYKTHLWYQSCKIVHTFDALVLLISIPHETSILSYCKIFETHTNIHLKSLWIIITIFFKNTPSNSC